MENVGVSASCESSGFLRWIAHRRCRMADKYHTET